MVDANMRWSVDEAIRAARALRELDLVWLEEPTIPDDVPGHARIVREGGLPIAAGENLHTLYEFRQLIAAGGVTFPEPDVTNCGGVTVFMKVCHLAEAFNLPVTSHGAHDLTVHLLAAAPNRSYLEAHGFGLDRFIAEPLRIEAGLAVAPERPGPRHRVRLEGAGGGAGEVRERAMNVGFIGLGIMGASMASNVQRPATRSSCTTCARRPPSRTWTRARVGRLAARGGGGQRGGAHLAAGPAGGGGGRARRPRPAGGDAARARSTATSPPTRRRSCGAFTRRTRRAASR